MFAGQRVLDVGTFDGFYAFLAEHRGAARVVAVDNEQYVAWVKDRWGVELHGGEGFRAIAELLGSRVEYVRGDALELVDTGERFDVILCFGILHRIENPLGLLRLLGRLLAPGGRLLVGDLRGRGRRPRRHRHGGLPARRASTPTTTTSTGASARRADALAAHAGFARVTVHATPIIDGHPRILATLERPGADQAASDGAAPRAACEGGRWSRRRGAGGRMRSSRAGSLIVPVVTLSPPPRSAPMSARESRKCSTHTPPTPWRRAQRANAAGA